MQTIQVIGYLGKDAEIKQFGNSEQKFVTFSVGVTRQYKDAEPRTTWYYCTRFYKEGGKLVEALTKGRKVLISGELSSRVFTPQDSEKQPQVSLRVTCDKILFLDSKRQEGQQEQQTLEVVPGQADLPPDLEKLEADMLSELSQEYNDSADDLPF